MARPLRVEVADGVYHVTSRGLERRAIVRDDIDRARWVELLARVADKRRWRVFAWALMDNHFHLFLRTPDPDLSGGMHDLNSGYVTGFNRRHDRVGPLFQGRFKAVLVERGYHYWELSRYVHLNPVRAGAAAQPDAYAWSSCSAYFQARGAPEWLAWEEVLGEYGRTMRTARRAYRQFLDAGLSTKLRSPLREATAGMLLGSPRFIDRTRAWLAKHLPDREVPAARALRRRPTVDVVVKAVCDAYRVSPASLACRGTHHNDARSVAVYVSRRLTTASLAQIGARFGGVGPSGVAQSVHRLDIRRRRDRRLAKTVREIESVVTKSEL